MSDLSINLASKGITTVLNQSLKSVALVATTLLFTVSFGVLSAKAESITFTLINGTDRPLEQFYASPPSSNNWEEDILGVDVLEPGESTNITINDGRADCEYDLKGTLGPGNGVGRGTLLESNVHICDGAVYQYTGKN